MGFFNIFRKKKNETANQGPTLTEMITGFKAGEVDDYFAGSDNANITDSEGNTILMRFCKIAARNGAELTCQLINKCIDKGADINLKNNEGDTALIFALASATIQDYDVLRVTRCLIANGADVNVMKDVGGRTLVNETIQQAVAAQNKALYDLLIESGATDNKLD